jgi:hypothetical protein
MIGSRRTTGGRAPRGGLRALAGAALVTGVLVAGIAAGGALGLAGQDGTAPGASPPRRLPHARVEPVRAATLLAWTPGGLPVGFGRRVAAMEGVDRAVTVWSGTVWMTGLSTGGEAMVRPDPDRPAYGWPIEVAGADLGDLGGFLPPSDRSILPGLAHGDAALGAGAASLLGAGPGSVLRFGTAKVPVAGVLADATVGANEAFVSRATALRLGIARPRYVIVAPTSGMPAWRLTARIRRLLPRATPLQVRAPGETPYFRQGDAVLPTVVIQRLFGLFAARLTGSGVLIDPAWVSRNIVAARVPLLGVVRCNRAIVPQLTAALREIEQDGLGHLIERRSYGGCFRPALLRPGDAQAGISHHAWGIAIDLNLAGNRLGDRPHQDRRVVETFRRWGFTWGGTWLIPFGAQFEVVTPHDGL